MTAASRDAAARAALARRLADATRDRRLEAALVSYAEAADALAETCASWPPPPCVYPIAYDAAIDSLWRAALETHRVITYYDRRGRDAAIASCAHILVLDCYARAEAVAARLLA
jgi:hypothetical protein